MRGLTNQCGVMGRGAVNGLLDHTGRNQLTARANIVTCPDRRAHGSVVHTRRHGGINPLGWPPPTQWLQPFICARSNLYRLGG
jgi:hypothetical protein